MGHLNIVLLLLQNGASPDVCNIVSDRGVGGHCLFYAVAGVRLSTLPMARLSAFLLTRTCVLCAARGDGPTHGSQGRTGGGGALPAEERRPGGRQSQGNAFNGAIYHTVLGCCHPC